MSETRATEWFPEQGLALVDNFRSRDLGVDDGPVGPQIFATARDRRGVTYLANNHGVREYDGRRTLGTRRR